MGRDAAARPNNMSGLRNVMNRGSTSQCVRPVWYSRGKRLKTQSREANYHAGPDDLRSRHRCRRMIDFAAGASYIALYSGCTSSLTPDLPASVHAPFVSPRFPAPWHTSSLPPVHGGTGLAFFSSVLYVLDGDPEVISGYDYRRTAPSTLLLKTGRHWLLPLQ